MNVPVQFENVPKFETQAIPEIAPACRLPGITVELDVLLSSLLIVEPAPPWWVSNPRYSSHIVTLRARPAPRHNPQQ